MEDGVIQHLPTEGLRPLKTNTPKRPLFSTADIDAICRAAFETRKDKNGNSTPVTENAQEFSDFIRLLAYSGARRNEALALKWADVDFERGQLTIGADGNTKNGTGRIVDFNQKLKSHLLDMKERSRGTSMWLFPSPQRGDKDVPTKTFKESLTLARNQAKMPNFNFHDCRHHFVSMCTMSRVDFLTVAAWIGHRDNGVLLSRTYAHLSDEHRRAMGQQVVFEPVVVLSKVGISQYC
jgi:integrase